MRREAGSHAEGDAEPPRLIGQRERAGRLVHCRGVVDLVEDGRAFSPSGSSTNAIKASIPVAI
jgi:hypothetical protein